MKKNFGKFVGVLALPQTGAKESTDILGFLHAGLGLFGFAADRKRKNISKNTKKLGEISLNFFSCSKMF